MRFNCCIVFLLIMLAGPCVSYGFQDTDALRKQVDEAQSDSAKLRLLDQYAKALSEHTEEFKEATLEMEALALQSGDSLHLGLSYLHRGSYYFYTDVFSLSLEYYIKARDVFDALGEQSHLAHAYNDISLVYSMEKHFDEEFEYLSKALLIYQELDDQEGISTVLINLGNNATSRKNYDLALDNYTNALELAQELDLKQDQEYVLNNIGHLYTKSKEYDIALNYFKEAMVISKEIDDRLSIIRGYNMMGLVQLRLGNYDEARVNYDKSLKMAIEENSPLLQSYNYLDLSLVDSAEGKYLSALQNYKRYSELNDSINSAQKGAQLASLVAKFGSLEKERLISNLSKENEIKDKEIESVNNENLWLMLSLALLATLAIVLYFLVRAKQKANQAILEQKNQIEAQNKQIESQNLQLEEMDSIKTKLFSIVAHDMRSPFISLQAFMNMLRKVDITSDEFAPLLDELNENLSNTSAFVNNLLFWSRNQISGIVAQPVSVDLYNTISSEIDLLTAMATPKNIQLTSEVEQHTFAMVDPQMIELIVNNLVSNAIKFSKDGGTVHISAATGENDKVTIIVTDTGIGMPQDEIDRIFDLTAKTITSGTGGERKSTGLGLILCKEFVDKNNGTIRVDSKVGEGSKFIVELPGA